MEDRRNVCPVTRYDQAEDGYAESVVAWIANPHAYFTAFGPAARAFQKRHPSERLRTMTLVAPGAELAAMRPRRISLDGVACVARSWEELFSTVVARLVAAQPATFAALQADGELLWLGCLPNDVPIADALAQGGVRPSFASWGEVVARVQWLFLMCGIRLNEVVVQVDPYTDEQWAERKREIDARRASDKAFMAGRRAAQEAWAAAHPDEAGPSAEDDAGPAVRRRFL